MQSQLRKNRKSKQKLVVLILLVLQLTLVLAPFSLCVNAGEDINPVEASESTLDSIPRWVDHQSLDTDNRSEIPLSERANQPNITLTSESTQEDSGYAENPSQPSQEPSNSAEESGQNETGSANPLETEKTQAESTDQTEVASSSETTAGPVPTETMPDTSAVDGSPTETEAAGSETFPQEPLAQEEESTETDEEDASAEADSAEEAAAAFRMITFMDPLSSEPTQQELAADAELLTPELDPAPGFSFLGWTTESQGQETLRELRDLLTRPDLDVRAYNSLVVSQTWQDLPLFDLSQEVDGDLVLYAVWQPSLLYQVDYYDPEGKELLARKIVCAQDFVPHLDPFTGDFSDREDVEKIILPHNYEEANPSPLASGAEEPGEEENFGPQTLAAMSPNYAAQTALAEAELPPALRGQVFQLLASQTEFYGWTPERPESRENLSQADSVFDRESAPSAQKASDLNQLPSLDSLRADREASGSLDLSSPEFSQSQARQTPAKLFDFSLPIEYTLEPGLYELKLYATAAMPETTDEAGLVTVTYDPHNGEKPVRMQIKQGNLAEELDPTDETYKPLFQREGYEFQGWSLSLPDQPYVPFNFAAYPVNENLTLHAHWQNTQVPVTLIFLQENPDDDGYSPAGPGQTVWAPSGSYIKVARKPVYDLTASHSLIYTDSWTSTNAHAVVTEKNGDIPVIIPDVQDSYFQFDFASVKRVSPDGTTVVQLYYRRLRVKLEFYYENTNTPTTSWRPGGFWAYIPDDYPDEINRQKYHTSYYEYPNPQLLSGPMFLYSFMAKYGQNIRPVWPWIDLVETQRNINPFFAWRLHPEQDYLDLQDDVEVLDRRFLSGVGEPRMENGMLTASARLEAAGYKNAAADDDWGIFATECLPGEEKHFEFAGRSYTISLFESDVQEEPFTYPANLRPGLKPALNRPIFSSTFGRLGNRTILSLPGDSTQELTYFANDKFGRNLQALFRTLSNLLKKKQIASRDMTYILLLDRTRHRLTITPQISSAQLEQIAGQNKLITKSGDDLYIDNLMYGEKIYDDPQDLLRLANQYMYKGENFIFSGWYTSPDFAEDAHFTLNSDSRLELKEGENELHLYAKWTEGEYTANYYLHPEDLVAAPEEALPFKSEKFRLRDLLPDPSVDKANFKGWYLFDREKGQYVERMTGLPMTSYMLETYDKDNNTIVDLCAKWKLLRFELGSLAAAGAPSSYQDEEDPLFGSDPASIVLPDYRDIWQTGDLSNPNNLVFVGWKVDDQEQIYQVGDNVPLAGDKELKIEAQWLKPDRVAKINYYPNGGQPSAPIEKSYEAEVPIQIWDNNQEQGPYFTREGFSFRGWAKSASALTPDFPIPPESSGDNTYFLLEGDENLYAVWGKNVQLTLFLDMTGNFADAGQTLPLRIQSPSGEIIKLGLSATASQTLEKIAAGTDLSLFIQTNVEQVSVPYEVEEVRLGNELLDLDPKLGAYLFTIPANQADDLNIHIKVKRDILIDTGLSLDYWPYVILLLLAGVSLALWLEKRFNKYLEEGGN